MIIPTHPSSIELTGKLLLHMLVCGHVVIHLWKIDCIEKLKVFLDLVIKVCAKLTFNVKMTVLFLCSNSEINLVYACLKIMVVDHKQVTNISASIGKRH